MDIKKKNPKQRFDPSVNSGIGATKKKKKKTSELSGVSKSTAVVVGIVWVFALLIATLSLVYSVVYAHVSFPGVRLSQKDVSNLSRLDVSKNAQKRVDAVLAEKWQLTLKDKKAEASVQDIGFSFDASKTTEQIWNFGRTENFFVNLKDQLTGLISHHNFVPAHVIDAQTLNDFVNTNLADFQEKPKNANLSFTDNNAIKIDGSNPGHVIDAALLSHDVDEQIANGTSSTLQLVGYAKTPDVTTNIARASQEKVVALTSAPIKLTYQTKTWTLDAADIGSWITPVAAEVKSELSKVAPNGNTVVTLSDKTANLVFTDTPQTDLVLAQTPGEIQSIIEATAEADTPLNVREFTNRNFGLDKNILADDPSILAIAVDKAKLDKTFDPITKKIDIPGKNAKLAFENNKIVVKGKSEDGRGVDRADALDKILAAVNNNAEHDIELVVNTIPAKVTEDNYVKLGIKELLATGESNFAGSPKNRKFNIALASSQFDGALVAPGEEFSFIQQLGEVDKSTGYLPELVIKGNKITPEYGGGTCQVSSTMFRAIVYAGLEVTERTSHSFVVSYYGTPGTDATVYIPHPDLRFINDTPNYILMQPRIEGTHLFFDFYGTSDGRTVAMQGPHIYGRSAGNAMKATWTQVVTRNSEIIRNKTFYSSYKPVTDFKHTTN